MTDKQTRALYIARLLLQDGFTVAGAAGILGNIDPESGFEPTNLENSKERVVGMTDAQYTAAVDAGYYTAFERDACGYGLCQWTARDRKAGMLKFHRARGASIGDFNAQVDWMRQEIKSYLKAYTVCKENTDPYTCGYVVCKHYEIPADTEAAAQYRGGLSMEWYAWLKTHLEPVNDAPAESAPVGADAPGGPSPASAISTSVMLLQLAMREDGYWCERIDGVHNADFLAAFKVYVGDVLNTKIP